MRFHSIRPAIAAGMILASASPAARAEDGRHPTCLERYGIGGRAQAVGLHYGFRVETVAVDSAADRDALRANDVIVKVAGEEIRTYEQMRAVLAEAYVGGGEVAITYLRGSSLEQRTMKAHLKVTSRRKPADDEEDEPVARRKPAVDEDEENPVTKRKQAGGGDEEKPVAKGRKPADDGGEKPVTTTATKWRKSAADDGPR